MEFKGTKGKWFVKNKHEFETDVYCGKVRIAEVKHYNTGEKDWSKNDPKKREGRANAQLIAAAPELLAALKSFIDNCYGTEMQESDNFKKGVKALKKAVK